MRKFRSDFHVKDEDELVEKYWIKKAKYWAKFHKRNQNIGFYFKFLP